MKTAHILARAALCLAVVAATALLLLASCGQAPEKQTQLAADFAKDGLVLGKPLSTDIKTITNPMGGAGAGEKALVCKNTAFVIGADGNLSVAAIFGLQSIPGRESLSLVDTKGQDGKSLFGRTVNDITQLYGEPSEVKTTTMSDGSNRTYVYYFSKGEKLFARIGLTFPDQGPEADMVTIIDGMRTTDFDEQEVTSKSLKTFPWPKGV